MRQGIDEFAMVGERIHVVGSSSSGKSTLGARLAELRDAPLVELDALNWLPNWTSLQAEDPSRLERRFRDATRGPRWVAAGSYLAFAQRAFWPRLDTVVWLDLPGPQLAVRVLRRSWRRWRGNELLWGTNRERFWPQLALWRREESLLWYVVTQHARKRRNLLAHARDPRWARIAFVRLVSAADVDAFVQAVERDAKARR